MEKKAERFGCEGIKLAPYHLQPARFFHYKPIELERTICKNSRIYRIA